MSNITWADKDKNAAAGSPEKQWRDVDANEVKTAVNSKVDKVTGKGLSEEDYTTAEKAKVANVPANTNAELAAKEVSANKSTDVNADQASNTKYPSVKAVYDWVVNLLTGKVSTTGNESIAGTKEFTSGLLAFRAIDTNTTVSYGLVLGDRGKYIRCNAASNQSINVPTNVSQAFAIGTEIEFIRITTNDVAFTASGGVTINSVDGKLRLNKRYSAAVLKKVGTDEWDLIGDLKT